MTDRSRRVQALRTDIHAVLNAVASEHAEGVIKLSQTLVCGLITAISRKRYACNKPAGPTKRSGFHQKDGQLVEQQAHKMHSYKPSNLHDPQASEELSAGAGVLFCKNGSIFSYCA